MIATDNLNQLCLLEQRMTILNKSLKVILHSACTFIPTKNRPTIFDPDTNNPRVIYSHASTQKTLYV